MGKLAFIPVSVGSGLLAGIVAKKLFERIWGAIDDQEAPDPTIQDVSWKKLAPALALEGVIFTVVRGSVDHGSRRLFYKLTGTWPGETADDEDED